MSDPAALTAGQILGIAADEPERLYSQDVATAAAEHLALVRRWHPDQNPGEAQANAVLAQVNSLFDAAKRKRGNGTWQTPNVMELRQANGLLYRRGYHRRHATELGELYVGDQSLTLTCGAADLDLFQNAVSTIAAASKPRGSGGDAALEARVREQVGRSLPVIERILELQDGGRAMVVSKTPDLLLLRDLQAHLGGRVPPRHAAWVLSTLLNLACYLQVTGLTHNALSADTVFVTPQHHSGAILGGWFYAAPRGTPLRALPQRTADLAPRALLAAKLADPRLDLDLIRALGREMLDGLPGTLPGKPAEEPAPAPLRRWLELPSGGDAMGDYRDWQGVLDAAYGKRRFVPLPVTATDIYNPATTA